MGRVFWKLCALISLVQFISIIAVGACFLLRDGDRGAQGHEPSPPPRATGIDCAAPPPTAGTDAVGSPAPTG